MRRSSIITKRDSEGDFEIEVFESPNPKRVIVCSHGNGVRRWDGEEFFYAVAEHYPDSTVLLVDQNQPDGDGVRINPLPTLVSRVNELIAEAKSLYPDTPILLLAHSMGCGVATFTNLSGVSIVAFVAPGGGNPIRSLINRYGEDVVHGKTVKTSDGLKKVITAEYCESVKAINSWEDEYLKFANHFKPVYVFESGADEIIGEERLAHRSMHFTKYVIIEGAKHNLSGEHLTELFRQLDSLI